MVDMLQVLKENRKEAEELLKSVDGCQIDFALWDEENEEYVPNGEGGTTTCIIRYDNGDEGIVPRFVPSVRYKNGRIEILDSSSIYEKTDGVWFPPTWADGISEWIVYDAIGSYVSSV